MSMNNKILKVLIAVVLLSVLAACVEKEQNSTDSSEKTHTIHSEVNSNDSETGYTADASSYDTSAATDGDDNIMPDIFSESENDLTKEEISNSEYSEIGGIDTDSSNPEQERENTESSDEWSKRY